MSDKIESIHANTYDRVRDTVLTAKNKVVSAINFAMVEAYWRIGKEIAEAIGDRAEYGKQLIKYLSEQLVAEFGKGFDESTLRKMRKFYLLFPIWDSLSPKLSWTHYRILIRIDENSRRDFYLKECANENWSVRQLFTSRYKLYLPKEDDLKEELQRERELIERRLTEEAGE